jgi:quinol-cytochrome oxidoreductase complex cytochrome b subunit/coenzyme F420-reducing hydrogenase delta subunit
MHVQLAFAPNEAPIPAPRRAARALERIERAFDVPFGRANPLRQLGALALLSFWLALASGAYLYVVFDTSALGAYRSIESLANEPWLGGLVRGLHRYSADAFAALTLLHLAREWAHGRYHGFRWFSWLTGVPLVILLVADGMVGYWLPADTRAQFVATAIGEWAGWLPGFGAGLIRNFVTAEAISDRLFSLLIFLHIGVGLSILLGLWVHLLRLVRPRVSPTRASGWSFAALLVALALTAPALSTAPADFARAPTHVPVDWFFLAPLALAQGASPALSWVAVGAIALLLGLLPWTRREAVAPVVVDPPNCTGCARCFEDCPYGAVVMTPRTDTTRFRSIARVDPALCAACGICVGACPRSDPFRRVPTLATGIDLPARPLDTLRRRLDAALAHRPGATVVFGCDHGADVNALPDRDVIALSAPCLGQVPPSFADYALKRGAHAVLIAGCATDACAFRFGAAFAHARLSGAREPHLHPRARGPRVQAIDAARGDEARVRAALNQQRESIDAVA